MRSAAVQIIATPLAYRVEEAARMIGIGKSKMFELIAAGAIRARKQGHATVIAHADLANYLESLPVIEPQKAAQ